MRLHTDPSNFSITAFLADQVTLVARQEKLSPGAALLRIQELSRDAEGRARLLRIIGDAGERETNPQEASKIAAVRRELAAWSVAAERHPHGSGHPARPDA
ncbi:hypothetical protein [Azospirillum thermophilum]|uniref:Uncharacterized protein n=1 Tax=Azospirillum thermophilum TaxID=2202148 RepID=A0A2S2CRA4_9PROT|nr:hypothetical protein [Azospirillum thermophilum]AWK87041.1 hypothetical protein DEW08_13105 [Azospirillum thermophilum]